MNTEIDIYRKQELATQGNLEEQFELLKKFNLPETAAERQYVVKDEKGHLILRKREIPIKIYPDDDGAKASVVTQLSKGYVDRIGLNRSKGKYNDAHKLVPTDCVSIEVGEVMSMSSTF